MDDLLKTLLGKLGVRLPGIGGVPEQEPTHVMQQQAQDQRALADQEKLSFPQRAVIKGIDTAADAVKGLNYSPTDEVPPNAGPAFKGAAVLGAALPLFSAKGIPGMYSRVEKVAESLPETINVNKLASLLRNRTSKEETDWRKVPQLLSGKMEPHPGAYGGPSVSKDAFVEHLQKNPLDVTVKELGGKFGDRHPTQWDNYQMPGASNYREDLIQLNRKHEYGWNPEVDDPAQKEAYLEAKKRSDARSFQGHHWEEPDVLVHTRHNERNLPNPNPHDAWEPMYTGSDGGKYQARISSRYSGDTSSYQAWGPTAHSKDDAVLAAEEARPTGPKGRMLENVQSDWHQRGAHSGYVRDLGNGEGLEKIGGNQELAAALERAEIELEHKTLALNNVLTNPVNRNDPNGNGERMFVRRGEDFYREVLKRIRQQYDVPDTSTVDYAARTGHLPSDIHNLTRDAHNARAVRDQAHDAIIRASQDIIPDAPFKDSWAELALKQQLLDIAHKHPELQWLGIAPSSELIPRGEDISPAFQDVQLPRTLEKLLTPFGGKIEQAHIRTKTIPHYSKPAYTENPDAPYSREIMASMEIPGSEATERQHIASTWPPRANERDAVGDVDTLMGLLSKNRPELFEQQVKAPIARLTPEMLAMIREKGFPLLLALLAARQGMQPVASHQQGQ